MAIETTGGGEVRVVSREEFFEELAAVTRQRQAATYLYLMLRTGGAIGVQWEQPGVDHLREYRVVGPDGPACPHCTILHAVTVLAPLLPLDMVRQMRTRPLYEAVLGMGQLPHLAFARQADPGVSWLGDCHAVPGDPHTGADCAEHGMTATIGDALDEIDLLPRAVLEAYPDDDTAVRDVGHRQRIAREWRDAAGEVANGLPEAAATWAFLRTSIGLGIPAPGKPETLFVLPDGDGYYDNALAELQATVAGKMRFEFSGRPPAFQELGCLVPDLQPTERWIPASKPAVDIGSGRLTRAIHLPSPAQAMSRRGRGVLLLYETRYAMGQRVASASREKTTLDWENEAALNVFEYSLLRGIGGEAYESAVDAYVQALRKTGDLLDRPEKVLDHRRRKALAQVFGDIDDRELHLWGSVAYRNAVMLLLADQRQFAEYLRLQAARR